AVGQASLLKALHKVTGCVSCSQSAAICFESVLGRTLGNAPAEYFLCAPVECPRCSAPIYEDTAVSVQQIPPILESPTDETDVVFVDQDTLLEAQGLISSCEHCSSRTEISFDQVLDAITGCDPTITEYVVCYPAKCPRCHHHVMEKTLICIVRSAEEE